MLKLEKVSFLKTQLKRTLAFLGMCMVIGLAMTSNSAFAVSPSGRQITDKDFLSVSNGELKNKNGTTVSLRGVNAGAWLIQESWMCPVNGQDRAWANLDTINALKNRGFSDQQIQKLFDSYQDNWFTTTDLDNLEKMNINLVRVPFWYRNFMSDENGTWITGNDLDNNPGIKRLDWIIEECGKRGMYVILDCHGAPGGQSMDHCCGTLMKNELYDSTNNRQILADLWTKIASRYKGNPIVAAYDILNEPQNNGGYSGQNSWAPGSSTALEKTFSVYDEMYKVIRSVDKDHVITMEAIWDRNCLPDPKKYGWTNLMYQMHIYDTSKSGVDQRVEDLKYYKSNYGVASYAGEFNCDSYEEYAMNKFNEEGISWSTWAYKGSKQNSENGWFLYYNNLPAADSTSDSYDTILNKWGTQLNTRNFKTNTYLADLIKKHANDQIVSGKVYSILNKYSDKALDIDGFSKDNGANVQQWDYTGWENQAWKVESLSNGYYKITNINSGKVLDVADQSKENGGNIQQWDYTGAENQQWSITAVNGYYQIKNRHSGKVLDVAGQSKENGANIQQWDYTGGENQLFSLLSLN